MYMYIHVYAWLNIGMHNKAYCHGERQFGSEVVQTFTENPFKSCLTCTHVHVHVGYVLRVVSCFFVYLSA